MIVRTTQDLDLIGCDPCAMPLCASPRKETRQSCGFDLPVHINVSEKDYRAKYKKKVYIEKVTYNDSSQTFSRIYSRSRSYTREYRDSPSCSLVTVATNYDSSDVTTYTNPPPESPGELSDVYTSKSTEDIPCEGTRTLNGVSEEWNVCSSGGEPVIGNYWTYVSTGDYGTKYDGGGNYHEEFSLVFSEATLGSYRFGIPETEGYAGYDVAHAAWVAAEAEWNSANPAERGDEPLEPIERSYYEIQWDEIFFPKDWDEWKVLKDAFDLATAENKAWQDADPETRGEEPTIPTDPGTSPTPAPSLVQARTWLYSTDDFSEWFEYGESPAGTEEIKGEVRTVNLMGKYYKCARTGVVPTAIGEIYELPT